MSLRLYQPDDTPLDFGQYKGKTPNEIADIDPAYIKWAYETFDEPPCSHSLYVACVDELDDRRDMDFFDDDYSDEDYLG